MKGAKVLLGGKRHSLGMTFYEPTVIGDVKNEMRISRYNLNTKYYFIYFCQGLGEIFSFFFLGGKFKNFHLTLLLVRGCNVFILVLKGVIYCPPTVDYLLVIFFN